MHAILLLPALAWLLRFTPVPERRRVRFVGVATVAYAALIAVAAAMSF